MAYAALLRWVREEKTSTLDALALGPASDAEPARAGMMFAKAAERYRVLVLVEDRIKELQQEGDDSD